MIEEILFGLGEDHLQANDPLIPQLKLQAEVWPAWRELQATAKERGIELVAVSSFRSYQRQLSIWNDKALGRRPLLDSSCQPLPFDSLSSQQKLYAILRWSALPGFSRHHWGTDMDVIDRACMVAGYEVQLTIAETCRGGIFESLHFWLDEIIGTDAACGFTRPYHDEHAGIAPEPWHLSYAPIAHQYEMALDIDRVRQFIYQHRGEIELADLVLTELDTIFTKYLVYQN